MKYPIWKRCPQKDRDGLCCWEWGWTLSDGSYHVHELRFLQPGEEPE